MTAVPYYEFGVWVSITIPGLGEVQGQDEIILNTLDYRPYKVYPCGEGQGIIVFKGRRTPHYLAAVPEKDSTWRYFGTLAALDMQTMITMMEPSFAKETVAIVTGDTDVRAISR